jgi:tetratricopeptide (TPR) repeat protein
MLSYVVDYYFSGTNPRGYHVANIIYHVVTAALVFFVGLSLTGRLRIALLAALLFATHPVHTDSVTYIAGRRDILSGLFFLLGFLSFVGYRRRARMLYGLGAFVSYGLALGSKEMAVTLPALFFLYDLMCEERTRNEEDKREAYSKVRWLLRAAARVVRQHWIFYGFIFVGAAAFTYYKISVASPSLQQGFHGGDPTVHFLTVAKIVAYYMRLLLFPVNLSVDYSYSAFSLATGLFDPTVVASLCVVALAFVVVARFVPPSGARLVAFGGLWFFITLTPVAQIFPHHELLAEHYLYIPSMGFVLVGAVFLDGLLGRVRNAVVVWVCFALVIALFCGRVVKRNGDFKDGLSLWKKTVETVPRCARAQNNLGAEYYERGNMDEAIVQFENALAIEPGYADAYNNLGNAYKTLGRNTEAREKFERVLRLRPRHADAWNNLGIAFKEEGRLGDAARAFAKALRLRPEYSEARNNLGVVYYLEGHYDGAIDEFKETLRLRPDMAEAHNNLGNVYKRKKLYDAALHEFQRALTLKPGYPEVYNNIGSVYKKMGNYDEAIVYFRKAVEANSELPEAHANLGDAYRLKGLPEEAIEEFEAAVRLMPSLAAAHLNLAIIYLEEVPDRGKALFHLKQAREHGPHLPQAQAIEEKIQELEGQGFS